MRHVFPIQTVTPSPTQNMNLQTTRKRKADSISSERRLRRAYSYPLPSNSPVTGLHAEFADHFEEQCRTKQPKQSLFFTKLPPEIRLLIYHDVYASSAIVVHLPGTRYEKHEELPQHPLALLKTCRIIHKEALDLLFTAPLLTIPSTTMINFGQPIPNCNAPILSILKTHIRPDRWQNIRRISIPVFVNPINGDQFFPNTIITEPVPDPPSPSRRILRPARGTNAWAETAEILATMKGLKEIVVRIGDGTLNGPNLWRARSFILQQLNRLDVHGGTLRVFSDYDYDIPEVMTLLEDAGSSIMQKNPKSTVEFLGIEEALLLGLGSRNDARLWLHGGTRPGSDKGTALEIARILSQGTFK